jgi:RAMA domain-containing protein/DUF2924 family protein
MPTQFTRHVFPPAGSDRIPIVAGQELLVLIGSGRLAIGATLFHQARRYHDRNVTATVVKEGLRVRGKVYGTPSAAARAITGKPVDGWAFWRLPNGERLDSLRPGERRLV